MCRGGSPWIRGFLIHECAGQKRGGEVETTTGASCGASSEASREALFTFFGALIVKTPSEERLEVTLARS